MWETLVNKDIFGIGDKLTKRLLAKLVAVDVNDAFGQNESEDGLTRRQVILTSKREIKHLLSTVILKVTNIFLTGQLYETCIKNSLGRNKKDINRFFTNIVLLAIEEEQGVCMAPGDANSVNHKLAHNINMVINNAAQLKTAAESCKKE